jgi:threonine dehydratase
MVTVSEEEIRDAVRFAFYTLKLVVEPSGALALAALLTGKVRGQRVGAIISGGNVDGAAMADILRESP